MKALRIRQWMVIGMLIVLILPRLFYEIPGLFDRSVGESNKHSRQETAMDTLMREVGKEDIARWRDPSWQSALGNMLATSHVGIILLDASDHEIYHSVPAGSESTAYRELSVMEQGQLRGKALFYVPMQTSHLATALAIIAGLCAILFIGWQMGRVVVKPLEAMSAAARRIAGGDLDFHLPESTVLEVADVRAAFHAMGKGLRDSLIRQSELEEERRFFISSIAHDLRSPLFVLRGFLNRLERGLASHPEKASRYAAICSKKAEQLEHLVSDLFSYSQLASLEQRLRHEPLDIAALLTDMVTEYLPVAKEREIDLVYNASATEHVLYGDAHMLRRAIGNLIDNALRYTHINGIIVIRLHVEDTRVLFTIADSGPGIPEHALPHIFEAFYRGDDSRNPEYGGTGLGLTIAQRILRAHKGDLTAQNHSQTGGAIFTGWIALHTTTFT
ncbi:sensor histidine kinase [Paenibacillus terrigena]|uniref:sensor histidine kinase n=1 Tax=Paenibacillus terrigena TaxID=369333 RepID=UPI00037AF16B|nr:HAMP domain-containing sensor histidine kinase [Paenibacillus terrigena]